MLKALRRLFSAKASGSTAEQVQCRLCGSAEVAIAMTGVKGHYGLYDIGRCASCGVYFLLNDHTPHKSNIIENSDVRKMVAGYCSRVGKKVSEDDLFVEYDRHREAAFSSYRDRVLVEKRGGDVLDVGCGNGYFLTLFAPPSWKRHGVDYNPVNIAEARRRNIDEVFHGAFVDYVSPIKFDVISMLEYIEHCVDPVAELKKAHGILKPGGLMLIETGNIESASAKEKGKTWAYLEAAPDHKVFFSDATIVKALGMAGFKETFFHGDRSSEVMTIFARKA